MDRNTTQTATERPCVIIIGAGPAGMASAVALKKRGIESLLLDENTEFAHSWKQHYQGLLLNSVRGLSGLPYKSMPSTYPRYPTRDQVISYLEDYAREFALQPRWGETVQRVDRDGDTWIVRTPLKDYRAPYVILATGANRTPKVPQTPGANSFPGKIIHSNEFMSGETFRGQRVLVVGAGNSAADISLDLLAHGALPCLSIRSPVYVTPLDMFNLLPAHITSLLLGKLPLGIADKIAALTLRLVVGDLSKYGLVRPQKGPLRALIEDQRVPMFDRGIVRAIKNGSLAVRPGLAAIEQSRVVFSNGSKQEFDVIIYATGYETNLAHILTPKAGSLNAIGIPTTIDNRLDAGLYFVGFRESTRGVLNDINLHARWIAHDIQSCMDDSFRAR